jgi:hypothetical protein
MPAFALVLRPLFGVLDGVGTVAADGLDVGRMIIEGPEAGGEACVLAPVVLG